MGKSIILMDDAKEMHLITKKALEPLDVNFISVYNESDLISAILANVGDLALVLLDIYMPEKNGFTIIQNLRDRFKVRKFKILFFSSLKEKKYILQGMSLKADGYIVKPFQIEDFRQKMLGYLK